MNINTPLRSLQDNDTFIGRHIGPDEPQIQTMLHALGYSSLSELTRATVPGSIALNRSLALAEPRSEISAWCSLS